MDKNTKETTVPPQDSSHGQTNTEVPKESKSFWTQLCDWARKKKRVETNDTNYPLF